MVPSGVPSGWCPTPARRASTPCPSLGTCSNRDERNLAVLPGADVAPYLHNQEYLFALPGEPRLGNRCASGKLRR